MLRKFKFFVPVVAMVVMSMAHASWCGNSPIVSGAVSGYVRDGSGSPQMGAAVEILGSAAHALKVFTDDRGFYSIAGLLPGTYSLKVSAPSFLPALREKVGLRPGAKLMVNVTLTTLFEAIQLGPLRGPADDDEVVRLDCFDLEPERAALAGHVRTQLVLGDHALQPSLEAGLEQLDTIFDDVVRHEDVAAGLDCLAQPRAPADDWLAEERLVL